MLKHRQGRNHRTRIVVFVGSPVDDDEKEVRPFLIVTVTRPLCELNTVAELELYLL